MFNVDMDNFPPEKYFPIGYFFTTLKRGISIEEVHAIVRGYEKVYHCGDGIEIYYYFSNSDVEALRFMILYDQNYQYIDLNGEDDDSITISLDGCQLGLISE